MKFLRAIGLWPSGRTFRRMGFGTMLWSVALASLMPASWTSSCCFGAFLLGLGLGLGEWEMEGGDR